MYVYIHIAYNCSYAHSSVIYVCMILYAMNIFICHDDHDKTVKSPRHSTSEKSHLCEVSKRILYLLEIP